MQTRIGSRYLQMYITKTANVSISGITEVSEIAQMVSLCLRSVVKMAENKMAQIAQMFGKKLGEEFSVRLNGEYTINAGVNSIWRMKFTRMGLYIYIPNEEGGLVGF
jgi:hypothetical protein